MKTSELHVIFGTGPLGKWTARELIKLDQRVRLINRSGKATRLPEGIEVVKGDAYDRDLNVAQTKGAAAIYQCAQPEYYEWTTRFMPLQTAILDAAIQNGAKFIAAENVYMYGDTHGQPMTDESQTWHYGLMARHWAEHNTTGPEIAYFQRQIERYGQPALDGGCGTGRLLLPFLRAGLDVDGCDVSQDMLDYCKATAEREGLSPKLYRQPLHALDLPRHYQTIFACGVFGIGVSREQDFVALQRFHQHLLPGGVLLLENYLPYEDAKEWPLWRKDARAQLPEPKVDDVIGEHEAGSDYDMHYRLIAIDPLEQRVTKEMRLVGFKDGKLISDEAYILTQNIYFCNELRALLEKAGFTVEAEKGDWTDADAAVDTDVIVFVARKRLDSHPA